MEAGVMAATTTTEAAAAVVTSLGGTKPLKKFALMAPLSSCEKNDA